MTLAEAGHAVNTTLGPIVADALGPVLMHEHVLWDLRLYWQQPADIAAPEAELLADPVIPATAWRARASVFGNRDNLVQPSWSLAAAEVGRFTTLGGRTIVDVTVRGIGRDAPGLRRVARQSGANVVVGTGYYVAASHPRDMIGRSVDALAEEMLREASDGIGRTGIRPGVIGEIGVSVPIAEGEPAVSKAAARVQAETRMPIIAHPGADGGAVLALADMLEEAGADPRGVVLSHIDARLIPDGIELACALAERGFVLGLDTFGRESFYESRGTQLPSDQQRIQMVDQLIRAGFGRSMILSHDVCFKTELTRFGGHGYGHILRSIIPRLRRTGVADHLIDLMMRETPGRLLTGAW